MIVPARRRKTLVLIGVIAGQAIAPSASDSSGISSRNCACADFRTLDFNMRAVTHRGEEAQKVEPQQRGHSPAR